MRRPRVLLVGLAAAVALLGCADDEGDVTAAGAATDSTCADLDASVLDQVEDPGPEDSRPEGAPPDPAEIEEWEAAGAALRRLAADGPEDLRADTSALAEVHGTDPTEVTEEAIDALAPATERLIAWGAEHCRVDEPIWRCARRATLRLVGAPIEGTPDPHAGETPEAVVDDADVEGERVEVERTDERVTFAWVDDAGLAVRSETAARVLGGWTSDQTTECDAFDAADGVEPIPETLPEELPPGAPTVPSAAPSTSIP